MAGLGADQDCARGVETDRAFDHFLCALNVSAGQIDLVDDRNNFQPVVDGEIGIGQRLRFHSLGGVHDQQRAFTGSQRTRDFVGKVDVPRGVDQVELVGLAILRGVHHADGVRLDGDAALALQVHGVEHLGLHLARGQRPGQLQQAVRQRRFSVVNMCNDRKIANKCGVHGCGGQCLILTGRQTLDLGRRTPSSDIKCIRPMPTTPFTSPFVAIDHVQLAMPSGGEVVARGFYRDLLGHG